MELGIPPYSPYDYKLRQSMITIVAGANKFVSNDSTRVYLGIQHNSILVVSGAYFTFGGVDPSIFRGVLTGNGLFELTWRVNYAMCCYEVWGNAFSVGDTFSVMEVLYNPLTRKERQDAKGKQQDFATKIKSFIIGKWGGSQ